MARKKKPGVNGKGNANRVSRARMGKWGVAGHTVSGLFAVGTGSLLLAAGADKAGKKLSDTGQCWLQSAASATGNPVLSQWITQAGEASSAVGEGVGYWLSGRGRCRRCRYRDCCPRLRQE